MMGGNSINTLTTAVLIISKTVKAVMADHMELIRGLPVIGPWANMAQSIGS